MWEYQWNIKLNFNNLALSLVEVNTFPFFNTSILEIKMFEIQQ